MTTGTVPATLASLAPTSCRNGRMAGEADDRSSNPRATLRVLCVDDNAALIEALRIKLLMEGDILPVGHLLSADGLVDKVCETRPDVVLLDIDMPGADPVAALTALTAAHPDVRTLILSGYIREEYVNRALDAGAWGYVVKSEEPAVIIEALRRVAGGTFAFGVEVARFLGEPWHSNRDSSHGGTTAD